MISGFLLISGLMAATYAVNAWKIREITEGRALYAAALEVYRGCSSYSPLPGSSI